MKINGLQERLETARTTPTAGDRQHVPTDQAAPELPNWEGFGLAIMEDWGAHCDTEASVRFDLAIKFGILRPIAGGFDPDTHVDDHGDAERGDPWFELNRRADLAAPSAPAEVEGLVELITGWAKLISDTQQEMADDVEDADHTGERPDLWDYHVFVDLTTAQATKDTLTVLQAENERLRKELDEADRRAGAAERELADKTDSLRRMSVWRDQQKEARGYHRNVSFDTVWAETCAKADRAEKAEAERDEWRGECNTAEAGLNLYRTKNAELIAERDTALAELAAEKAKRARAVDAETRACAEVASNGYGKTGNVMKFAILARLDQRKEAGK